MRLTLSILGIELDISLGPVASDEPEAIDHGSVTSYPVGFAPSVEPDWEKPLNRYDEPGEDYEDV